MYRGQSDGRLEPWHDGVADFDLELGTGGTVADYDGDGDLDVLVLRWGQPDVLLRNEGRGDFVDATDEVGLSGVVASTTSAWGDVDRDGDLDLFVGSYDDVEGEGVDGGSFLYENVGGSFVQRPSWLPEALDTAYTRVAGFHDVDGDGYPELYVVNDIGSVQPNLLLRNRLGRLEVDDGRSGLNLAHERRRPGRRRRQPGRRTGHAHSAMGRAVADALVRRRPLV